MELKERMRLISSEIKTFLPLTYTQSLEVLKKVKSDLTKKESMSLQAMIFQDYVEVYGFDSLDDFDNSLDALEYFTIDSSSEFAIRHFLIKYEKIS